ncbi:MAG: hypothetical protein A2Y64_01030 [Candidatus Coatesbacteria bacterium RBG_13_66_14]|uniref:Uncharacterized protein n=1 Tax=Candidatus Coatesbacteria bacterium RBG_13_66_14 TaxID=1817816 RepID=A0A1F5F6U1_9BACT|nr:MAG: hypothetical protein A2Y64_01030 [Candidatus Coatesbacteria bacterium RBG_13_66_14]
MRTTFFILALLISVAAQTPAPTPFAADEEFRAEADRTPSLEAEATAGIATGQTTEQPSQLAYEDSQGRWILSWGSQYADDHSWFEYYPLATTFTAPFRCRLVAYRIWWSGYPAMASVQAQSAVPTLDVMLYADEGQDGAQRPSGEPRFNETLDVSWATAGWIEVDLSDWRVDLNEGEVFHPGWSSNTELSNGLSYAVVPGSYSCWYSSDSPQGPVWMDAQGDWTHVVEAVVERM